MAGDGAVLSVRDLTERLRATLEGRFPFVWVRGEVGNLSRPGSGHVYFCLKDADAQLQCVWFRQNQQSARRGFDPLTGEVRDPAAPSPLEMLRNGLDLLCAGRVGVYAPRGQYQLVVDLAQPAGDGLLAQAFEAAKRHLAAAGYFAAARKRPLPADPRRVALITSPDGAAIHDFCELAARRGSGARIRLFPVLVQGEGAAPSIVRAVEAANAQGWAQVIVCIRGGGALEDLWAFNEEPVATAIFQSRLPVLAGIGHEVDVTLADMTADVRAATPSHAAQLLWPDRAELLRRVDAARSALDRAVLARLADAALRLDRCRAALRWNSPARQQARLEERLARLSQGLRAAASQWLGARESALDRMEQARRLSLGPARLEALAGRLGAHAFRLERACAAMLARRVGRLGDLSRRLGAGAADGLARRRHALDTAGLALEAANPLAPLRRGYALARMADGRFLRSVRGLSPGMRVVVRLADGALGAVVDQVRPDGDGEGGA